MKRVSVKAALTALLLAIIAISGLQGGSAVFSLLGIANNVTQIDTAWLPSVDTLHRMNTLTSDIRLAEAEHILSADKAAMTKIEDSFDGMFAQFDDLAATYEKLISSDEEAKDWAQVKDEWKSYRVVHNNLLAKSSSNQNAEAAAVFSGKMRDDFDAFSNHLLKLVDLNVEGAKAESASASSAAAGAKITTIV
jgi:methyl-accepting chemotaxis protein